MINIKQMELSRELFQKLKKNFSEVELVEITESPENPNAIWVHIGFPSNEDRKIEFCEMASELSTDILLNYGYSILISSSGHVKASNI